MGMELLYKHRIDIQRNVMSDSGDGNHPFNWTAHITSQSCVAFATNSDVVERWGGRPSLNHWSILIPVVDIDVKTKDRILFPCAADATPSNPSKILNIIGVQHATSKFTVVITEEFAGDTV